MLAEIIIYIALFATLFSGAFSVAFQTFDEINYLKVQKQGLDSLYYFSSKLDGFVKENPKWETISKDSVLALVPSLQIEQDSFSPQIVDTATSTERFLFITLKIKNKKYTFSYAQSK